MERVWQLPVVAAAVEFTSVHYQHVGDSSPVVKSLMTTAEKSISYAAQRSKPVLEKFNKPILAADGLACRTLDIVEQKIPLITKTPDEITEETKRAVAMKVALIKNGSAELFTTVKGFGERQALVYLQTSYGQLATSSLETLMDKAGWYIDNHVTIPKGGEYPAQPVSDVQAGQTTQKVLLLASKVQQVVLLHANAQMSHLTIVLHIVTELKTRSTQQLTSARVLTVEVLAQMRNKASSSQETAVHIYRELLSRAEREGTLEHRLMLTAQQSVDNVVAVLKGVSDTVKLPPIVQTTIYKTRDNLLQLQHALANMKVDVSLLHQLREQLVSLQSYFSSALSSTREPTKSSKKSSTVKFSNDIA